MRVEVRALTGAAFVSPPFLALGNSFFDVGDSHDLRRLTALGSTRATDCRPTHPREALEAPNPVHARRGLAPDPRNRTGVATAPAGPSDGAGQSARRVNPPGESVRPASQSARRVSQHRSKPRHPPGDAAIWACPPLIAATGAPRSR
ncbi:hypothetical protein PSCLAVI8L_240005 [Pseudoclavibacter sp. 8L]|nr:hypothetical protein PSCLAVI8L_240005 [Pseudoclavibacter sp. 8L]